MVSVEKASETLQSLFPHCFYYIEFGENGIHTLKVFDPFSNHMFEVVKFIADKNYVIEYHETIVNTIVHMVMMYGADVFDKSVLTSPDDTPFNFNTAVRIIGVNYRTNQYLYFCPEKDVLAAFDNSCAYEQFVFDYAEKKAKLI